MEADIGQQTRSPISSAQCNVNKIPSPSSHILWNKISGSSYIVMETNFKLILHCYGYKFQANLTLLWKQISSPSYVAMEVNFKPILHCYGIKFQVQLALLWEKISSTS